MLLGQARLSLFAHHEQQEEGPPFGLACAQQGCQTQVGNPQRHGRLQSPARCQVRQLQLPCRLSLLLWLCLASWQMLLAPLQLRMRPLAWPQLLPQLRLAVRKLLPLLSQADLLHAQERPQ